jgi:hypothetical protein
MVLTTLLLCAFSLALLSYGQPETLENHNSSDLLSTCDKIAAAISGASQVFFPRECVILISDAPNRLMTKLHLSTCSTLNTFLPRVPRRQLAR